MGGSIVYYNSDRNTSSVNNCLIIMVHEVQPGVKQTDRKSYLLQHF